MLVFVKESTDGKRKKEKKRERKNMDRTQTKLTAFHVRGIISKY